MGSILSVNLDAWVDDCVKDVHDDIHEDHQDPKEDGHAKDDGVVPADQWKPRSLFQCQESRKSFQRQNCL